MTSNVNNTRPLIVSPAEKLRTILNNGTCNIIPCCSDGLTAKLVEQAGFSSTFMSGFSVSATRGFPDCQLVSFEEMTGTVRLSYLVGVNISTAVITIHELNKCTNE